MLISLIHPSRGRVQKAWKTYCNWEDCKGVVRIEHLLSVDYGDKYLMEYDRKFKSSAFTKFFVSDNRSAVDAINHAATKATGDILVVMSDDFEAPQDWGRNIIEQTQGKIDWIAKTPDGIQKWIITLPIMDRVYYNRFGYIYHPDYLHMFCDTELTCVADLTGRKITLDIPFVHNHYSTGKSVKDEVSIRADKTWDQGEKLFIERARRNFDLVNPPGKITSVEYIHWMKSKGYEVNKGMG